MSSSPFAATANDKTSRLPPVSNTATPRLPAEALPDYNAENFEFDQHVLLSPPPSTIVTDPFDDERQSLCTSESLDSDTITRRNIAAYASNAQHAFQQPEEGQTPSGSEPIATGLQIRTDLPISLSSAFSVSNESDSYLRHSMSTSSIPRRTPSIRAALQSNAGSLSPGSAYSSPQLAAMLNITPLPSPIEASRDPWRVKFRARSRGSSLVNAGAPPEQKSALLSPTSSPPKRKAYNGLHTTIGDSHAKLFELAHDNDISDQTKNRSVSDYVPDAVVSAKPRNVAVSSNLLNQDLNPVQSTLHREAYLAVQRGFTIPSPALRTPSASTSTDESSADTDVIQESQFEKAITQFYTVQSVTNGHPRRYRFLRQLGQGTFSKVYLAVRQIDNEHDTIDYARDSTNLDGVRIRSRRLVAVKVVEQGPAGGADAERVEVSLRREVEILKVINHPSLVHLKAFGTENNRSLLVLNYCPGGDLFEVASSQLDVLVPSLVRRIFAELVSAVRYLHQKFIVHRDIKLESKSRISDLSKMLM